MIVSGRVSKLWEGMSQDTERGELGAGRKDAYLENLEESDGLGCLVSLFSGMVTDFPVQRQKTGLNF